MTEDRTPEGDEIHTHTLWLTFREGDVALTLDTTKFDAAMQRAIEAAARGTQGGTR